MQRQDVYVILHPFTFLFLQKCSSRIILLWCFFRNEMHPFGVKVSIIEPGFFSTLITNTDLQKENIKICWEKTSEEVREAYGEEYFRKGGWNYSMNSSKISFNQKVIIFIIFSIIENGGAIMVFAQMSLPAFGFWKIPLAHLHTCRWFPMHMQRWRRFGTSLIAIFALEWETPRFCRWMGDPTHAQMCHRAYLKPKALQHICTCEGRWGTKMEFSSRWEMWKCSLNGIKR